MATLPPVAGAWPRVVGPVAARAARATGLVRRASTLTGARFVQPLVFGGLAQPRARLSPLAQTAAALGVPLSPPALAGRFGVAAAECLRAGLAAAVPVVLAADPVAVPVRHRVTPSGRPAAVAAVWPGGGGSTATRGAAALTLGGRLDLASGQLRGPDGAAGRTNDRATRAASPPLPPGALRRADRGCCSLAALAAPDARGVPWRARGQPGTALFTADGQRHELLPLRAAAPGATLDLPVRLGVRQRVPARLLAVRVPPEVAAAQLALCAWTVCLTSATPDRLTLREALVLARARWPIALLCKRWQRPLRVDAWRRANPWLILTEVYATRLAAVAQHGLVLGGCGHDPDRRLAQAAPAIPAHAPQLAAGFATDAQRAHALQAVVRCLAVGRLNARKTAPATTQLLLALDAVTFA